MNDQTERLIGLDDDRFKDIVEHAIESHELSDDLEAAFVARQDQGRLQVDAVFRVLAYAPLAVANWARLGRRLIEGMARKPADAVSLLHMGVQDGLWSEPAYKTRDWGPDHLRVFETVTRCTEHGNVVTSGARRGTSLKASRQLAALDLVARIADVNVQLPDDAVPDASHSNTKPAAATAQPNPKGKLLELCQGRRWPTPTFEHGSEGPHHAPTYIATAELTVGGKRYRSKPGHAGSKRDAEQVAAASLLGMLPAPIASSPRPATASSGSRGGGRPLPDPISALNILAQKQKWKKPSYDCRSSSSPAEWTCTCVVRSAGVVLGEATATADSKQASRNAAASSVYLAVVNQKPDSTRA